MLYIGRPFDKWESKENNKENKRIKGKVKVLEGQARIQPNKRNSLHFFPSFIPLNSDEGK
jgi:hypothetical protein